VDVGKIHLAESARNRESRDSLLQSIAYISHNWFKNVFIVFDKCFLWNKLSYFGVPHQVAD